MNATPRPLWTARILAILPFLFFAAFIVFALLPHSFDPLLEPPPPLYQRLTTVGFLTCLFYAFPVNFVFGLLGLSEQMLGIAYFSTVSAYSCALSYVFYRWGKYACPRVSATAAAAISGGFGAFFLLASGLTPSPPEALWVLVSGLLVAGFFLARSPKSSVWLFTFCLSVPSLSFTVPGTAERFVHHQTDRWHFGLFLSAGIFLAALIGTCLGKLSVRIARQI